MLDKLKDLLDDIKMFKFSNKMFFVGGTALEMQINHRTSYDIDLATTDRKLKRDNIDRLVNHLRDKGRIVEDVLSIAEIDNFLNDGLDLRDYQQDYQVDNIRVTFFTFGDDDKQKSILKNDGIMKYGTIDVASEKALFKMKSLVLIDRHKSRDLFDLYYLTTQRGFRVDEIFSAIAEYKPHASLEIAKNRLTSNEFPSTDEGIDEKEVGVTTRKITSYFREQIT